MGLESKMCGPLEIFGPDEARRRACAGALAAGGGGVGKGKWNEGSGVARTGRCRLPPGVLPEGGPRKSLTIRSSREWNATTTRRPCLANSRSAATRTFRNSSSSLLI